MPTRDLARTSSIILGLHVTVIAVATLFFGREILIPLALAILLSFVLAPLVRILHRWRVPRPAAVLSVVVAAMMMMLLVGAIVSVQVSELAADLPRYERTMRDKIEALRSAVKGNGTIDRAMQVIQDLGREVERPTDGPSGGVVGTDAKPIPVEVRRETIGPLRTLSGYISPLLHPLATVGLVLVFAIFILLQREELRNRMIRLGGAHDIQRTTAAIDDAAHRLSRLLLMQLALNCGFGVVIGLGLWALGVPSPILWGILAAILRFVPYIGAVIAALCPIVLAAAVDPGWSMLLWTVALFAIVEPVLGHGIEPLLYGQSTGLQPIAVVASATVWTWLWGPIGLILATPLTVCLVVLGRHIEQLALFDVMLGDRPALSADEVFYQRMLANDPAEAVDQAEACLADGSLSAYLDTVALPGLRLAAMDEARGALEEERIATVRSSVAQLSEEIAEDLMDDSGPMPAKGGPRLLVVAARTGIDEAVGHLLAVAAREHGVSVTVESANAIHLSRLFEIDFEHVGLVCVSAMALPKAVYVRHALRRLRRRAGGSELVVGAWLEPSGPALEELRRVVAPTEVVTRFHEVLAKVEALKPVPAPMVAPELDAPTETLAPGLIQPLPA